MNTRRISGALVIMALAALLVTFGYYYGEWAEPDETMNVVQLDADPHESSEGDLKRSMRTDKRTRDAATGDSLQQTFLHRETRVDPLLEDQSIYDVARDLLAKGELSEPDMAMMMLDWIDACSRSDQIKRRAASGRPGSGLMAHSADRMGNICDELAMDVGSDRQACMEAWREIAFEEGTKNPFIDQAEDGHMNIALSSAAEAAFESLNYHQIFAALAAIVISGELESPFPDIDPESAQFLFSGRIKQDAALALLCENLGGCSGDHPLVVRHCLGVKRHDGCYYPRDVYDAIEQTQTPIQQTVFWSLLNQVNGIYRKP
ncbi:hypothetical protein IC757_15000 [Wenzhouxiangella sp. AB-CW3]|uniref:hypothetical protein n=1 Tax=Wenzhouxiangella sp. AB-CW3 TaxID=2771012 RepID=UPI00168AC9CA|nr:hypothetical protein [Wenzhouxiangella sp. AB-CW3]QOC22306.1 hypothetical protein IC757_15000 [Wenzhouxiangella sp. AB-CW3]